ncbi:MAG: HD domain-containing protein [Cyclobacteriaceae bacterium]|nr:HD domain-containing protein [Cyclobacteriaceae bacterium]
MDQYNPLLEEVENYVSEELRNLPDTMMYHSLPHTREVVKGVRKIGAYANLNEEKMLIATLAAWFHDIGYLHAYRGHENHSIRIAEDFLSQRQVPRHIIDAVVQCIEKTKPQSIPENTVEKVLHDADFIHISKGSYFDKLILLRKEKEVHLNEFYDDVEWYENNLEFLNRVKYYSVYGKTILTDKLEQTIIQQEKIIRKAHKSINTALEKDLRVNPDKLKEMRKKLSNVEGRPDRGIETMFRLTSRNHLALSSMADNKANILITVNSIIISVLIGSLLARMQYDMSLMVPSSILLTVNLVTIVFAILATRPNVSKGVFTKQEIKNKKVNLLFFGNFHQMSRDDYQWGMQQLMLNGEYLYSSLIDDIYYLGKVLGKKYQYLRWSYTIFMIGIIISVLAFAIMNIHLFLPALNIQR